LVPAAPSRALPAKRRLALEVACGHDLGSPLGALFVDRGDYRTHENPCLGPRASCPADCLPRLAHSWRPLSTLGGRCDPADLVACD